MDYIKAEPYKFGTIRHSVKNPYSIGMHDYLYEHPKFYYAYGVTVRKDDRRVTAVGLSISTITKVLNWVDLVEKQR